MADRKHGCSLGGGKGGGKAPPQKCIGTLFAARGPEEPLEPRRGAEAGGAGALWNRGDAFWGLGARKFSRPPQGTQGRGGSLFVLKVSLKFLLQHRPRISKEIAPPAQKFLNNCAFRG